MQITFITMLFDVIVKNSIDPFVFKSILLILVANLLNNVTIAHKKWGVCKILKST